MVHDPRLGRDVKKNDWEIELFGTGKQAVIPPSIHPDTGKPYVWRTGIDPEDLDMGIGRNVRSDLVRSWGAQDDAERDDDDDVFGVMEEMLRLQPIGLERHEIDAILADLPDDWVEDRDRWLEVGQALHHEHEGSQAGFGVWCEWSERSGKFDPKDSRTVWRSFRNRTRNPVRMPSLIHAAGLNKRRSAHDWDDGDDGLPVPVKKSDADLDDFLSDILDGPPAKSSDDLSDILGDSDGSTAPGAETVPALPWDSCLHLTGQGITKSTAHNVKLIVLNDPRLKGIIAYNAFLNNTVLMREPPIKRRRKRAEKPVVQLMTHIWRVPDRLNGLPWTDDHTDDVMMMLEAPESQGGYEIAVKKNNLEAAITHAAHVNVFHPLRDRLDALEWSGASNIDHLFVDYLGAPDDAYHRLAARVMMLGAVARIHEPGHKFDFVPILEGPQGIRKSTFIKTLGMGFSSELSGDFHDEKRMVEQMQGNWIIEIPELQGMHKAEVTLLKAFVSRDIDKVRLPWDRRSREFPRQCIFIGSTNDQDYLRDTTGNRRYWPIKCGLEGSIDIDRLRANINDLWAEAVHIYKEMRVAHPKGSLPLFLDNSEADRIAKGVQESRRIESEEEMLCGQIENWLNQPVGAEMGFDELDADAPQEYRDTVCVKEIRIEFLGHDKAAVDQRWNTIVGKAMNLVPGWTRGPRERTEKYGRQYIYYRDGSEAARAAPEDDGAA